MQPVPIAMHEDEVTELAHERLGTAERPREYEGRYLECPGCARLVHHSDRHDHPTTCVALRALVVWEAGDSL